jgi:hypothetical protein
LLSGTFVCSAQTGDYTYSGTEQTITLDPGLYDITAYGAVGGSAYYEQGYFPNGGFGAEMEGQFYFAEVETLTILVGGVGSTGGPTPSDYINNAGGGGGGGGSFVVNGSTPLVIAGGGAAAATIPVAALVLPPPVVAAVVASMATTAAQADLAAAPPLPAEAGAFTAAAAPVLT